MKLLTQNSDLKKTGIYGWTLPAHWVTLSDGTRFNTCPNAGICAGFCYAKSGAYMFKNVKKAHLEKLELVLKRPKEWYVAMINELLNPKYRGKFIRIHDSGDFFNEDYALRWIKLATRFPSITFYTYTKEVSMFKRLSVPLNFIVIYSLGGREDHLIDIKKDRHSDVFPDEAAMIAAGYNDIKDDDKQAAIHPNHKVGLYRNNIPHLVKKQGSKTFSEWQTKNSKDGIKETGND